MNLKKQVLNVFFLLAKNEDIENSVDGIKKILTVFSIGTRVEAKINEGYPNILSEFKLI